MRRFLPALVVAGFAAVALLTSGLVASAGESEDRPPTVLGPGPVTVTLTVERTRFDRETIRVRPGTDVRFVVDNADPINHELIVGPPEVHDIHEAGTHAEHPPVPGEVSVGPNSEATTIYRFTEPGEVVFACHLPGHFAYGMKGIVEVVDDSSAVR